MKGFCPPPPAPEVLWELEAALNHEAWLLDNHRYSEWLALLADDIAYTMPVTTTLARGSLPGRAGSLAHFDEDHYSLAKRVERLLSDHAWTEDPPSRTRRFVTNLTVAPDEHPKQWQARSYLLLFRSRGDRLAEWLSAERQDLWRKEEGESWVLGKRTITVDEAVLRTQNLAVFL